MPAASSPPRILLVDDNADNLTLMQLFLCEAPYQVDVAANGREAVEKFAATAYDLVFMDLEMPVLDGYEAARRIRALDRADAETVPIIAMTADAFVDDVQKCFDAGMNGHIAKPIDPDTLYRTLADVLSEERQNL